jgi:predicted nucleic acid-binding protein
MALLCREQGIDEIASFDRDFDELPWLTRVADPAQLL